MNGVEGQGGKEMCTLKVESEERDRLTLGCVTKVGFVLGQYQSTKAILGY